MVVVMMAKGGGDEILETNQTPCCCWWCASLNFLAYQRPSSPLARLVSRKGRRSNLRFWELYSRKPRRQPKGGLDGGGGGA